MNKISIIAEIVLCALLVGCMGGNNGTVQNSSIALPTPASAPVDVIRPGDKITVRLTGVPSDEYVIEVEIPASGDITVPLLTRSFHAVGRNSAELADEISQAYKTDKIFTNPNVTVIPEERYVNVGGDVRGPSRVAYTPDMTLLTAINSCGGFDEYANRKAVRVTRGQQIFTVNAVLATSTPNSDPKLYPGDQIYVPRTIF
jgi:protein involved in polysaccharide export with SLBB domain